MTSHICPGLERAEYRPPVREKRTNGQIDRHSHSTPRHTHSEGFLYAFISHVQSYFIQKCTAITVSFPQAGWMYNFLLPLGSWQFVTIVGQQLLFWQAGSCHWGSVWAPSASQACLDTDFCHSLSLVPLLSLPLRISPSTSRCYQTAHLSLQMFPLTLSVSRRVNVSKCITLLWLNLFLNL